MMMMMMMMMMIIIIIIMIIIIIIRHLTNVGLDRLSATSVWLRYCC